MELRVTGRARNLEGTIRIPGDKSISHRALLFGAMAAGTSRVTGALRAGVTDVMVDCLGSLGVVIENLDADNLLVHGTEWQSPDRPLICGNSGTTMRLLMGALSGSAVSATLAGSRRLSQRPMARVADPLRKMGARITGLNGKDRPPLNIAGSRLHGIEYEMRVASAQVKTAILLAGIRADGRTLIHEPIVSRDHSERLLRHLGVSVEVSDGTLTLDPTQAPLAPFQLTIPGDISAAAFPIAAALLTPGSEITVRNVGLNPTRTGLLEVLGRMGAQIETNSLTAADDEPTGDLLVVGSDLIGTEIQPEQVVSLIDEIPILAVLATRAHGETRIRGAAELRLKESDRLSSMAGELKVMGAPIEEHPDGLTIQGPASLVGARVNSHGDHRVAMALTIAGMLASGETIVSGAEVVRESYPAFVTTLHEIGAELH